MMWRFRAQRDFDAVERVLGHRAVRLISRTHIHERRGIEVEFGTRLLGSRQDGLLQLVYLTDVALVHVGTHERLHRRLEQAEVLNDPLICGATPNEAARGIVGGANAVKRNMDVRHTTVQQQVDHVFVEQVAIRKDPCLVGTPTLLGKAYEPRRERFDHIRRYQRFATEPSYDELLRICGVEHASCEPHDVDLNLG